jgi:NCAIR mutase (PurE)-related protein
MKGIIGVGCFGEVEETSNIIEINPARACAPEKRVPAEAILESEGTRQTLRHQLGIAGIHRFIACVVIMSTNRS